MKFFNIFILLLTVNTFQVSALSLEDALQVALQEDPAQEIYQAQQASLSANAKNSRTLPDPSIKIGGANLPIDSFSLEEEAMTQLTIGLSQQFSRGASLVIAEKGFHLQSKTVTFLALDRRLLVKKSVRDLWLNILLADREMELVNKNKALFGSFYRDLESKFSLGLIENEDLISADIELSLFDEKLAKLKQQSLTYRSLLSKWIGGLAYQKLQNDIPAWFDTQNYISSKTSVNSKHYDLLSKHPKVLALKQNIMVASNNINMAKQSYKPKFKVELGYGYRFSDADNGEPRSNLLSGFISMDLPIFTEQRQDQQLISAQQNKVQKQVEHHLLMRELNALLSSEITNYKQLISRQLHYENSLLKQAKSRVDALVQSYQSNTQPFKTVIQAYIDELNFSIEYQKLYFDSLKSLSKIRYFQAL